MLSKKIMLFAFGLSLFNHLACFSVTQTVVADARLLVQPGSQIEAGQTATISVDSQNLPRNLKYQWRTDGGVCSPQDSYETTYRAPDSIGELPEKKVKVTVEFYFNSKPFHLFTELTIIPRRNVAEPPGTTAAPPPPVAGIPPTPVTSGKPTIEIIKPGVFDPLGGRLGPGRIEGRVSHVEAKDYVVLLYTLTNQWYLQPLDIGEGRFTPIDVNHSFANSYHVGEQYAALLCRRPCDNPPTPTSGLPLSHPNVVAWTIVDGVRTKN